MLGSERFEAPEILFNPNRSGYDQIHNGVSEILLKTLSDCPIDCKKALAN
jgi:hypothetical protein